MPNPVGSDLIIAMQGCFCNPNRGGRAEGACPQILLLRRGCFLSKKLQILRCTLVFLREQQYNSFLGVLQTAELTAHRPVPDKLPI